MLAIDWDHAEPVDWRVWAQADAGTGESPIWDAASRSLYWIDLFGPTLNRSDGTRSEPDVWHFPDMMGSYGLHADGSGAVVGLSSGIYDFRFDGPTLRLVYEPPYDPEFYRFNDGRCDARGRFWIGTNRQPRSGRPRGSAGFWRLDDRGLVQQIEGVTIANGLAFSPSGETLYLADAANSQLVAYDYDLDKGEVANRRVFAELDEGLFPDGAAVDREGGYWIAMFGTGVIARFAPDGSLSRLLQAPVNQPTMVAFGGEGGRTMFVTSARRFLDPDELAREPLAGSVFAAEVGAAGMPEPRFAFLGSLRSVDPAP